MTGYRAQLTSYFGSEAEQAGQLQPTSQLMRPRMVVYNVTRIGQSASYVISYDQVPLDGYGSEFETTELLHDSSNFQEPYGTLIDCEYLR